MVTAVSVAACCALSERKDKANFEIIALNDIADQASIEYLTV